MNFKIASVDSIIIYFSDEISKRNLEIIKKAYLSLKNKRIEGIIEIIPSYSSILVTYDIFRYDFESIKLVLENSFNSNINIKQEEKILTIDVYYGVEVGFDIVELSNKTNLSISEIIKLHSQKIYDVYAIGFLPGFTYLGNVDEKISLPRLDTPRKLVPKGSVGIADSQTAIYPQNSPGGWNIIGRTSKKLFDKKLDNLCPLRVGDKVKFNPIDKKEFLNQGGII